MAMHITLILFIFNVAQIRPDSEMEPRIVEGRGTKIQKHPYSAFILVFQNMGGFMCGGSIINQKIILTAAHCFEKVTKKSVVTVTVGSSRIQHGRKILVQTIKSHPKYDKVKIINDIALAGLMETLTLGKRIKKIVMATKKPKNGIAKLAGWGLVQEVPDAVATTYIHELSQKYMSRSQCKKIFKHVQNGTFCGGKLHETSYPSIGDSGSPLVIKDYLQIGLVSYKNLYVSRSVIIYTDVAYFYPWIVKTAKSVYCNHVVDQRKITMLSSEEYSDE